MDMPSGENYFTNNQSDDSKELSSSKEKNNIDQPISENFSDDTNQKEGYISALKFTEENSPYEADKTPPATSNFTRSSYDYGSYKKGFYSRHHYGTEAAYDFPHEERETVQVDVSKIKAGELVTHEKFGTGRVKEIEGSVVIVTFSGADKKFQFPRAFEQGFLKIDE